MCCGQGRAELLCGFLVLVLAVVPEIEERLREAQPGRGRQTTAGTITGSANGFFLGTQLSDKQKQAGSISTPCRPLVFGIISGQQGSVLLVQ